MLMNKFNVTSASSYSSLLSSSSTTSKQQIIQQQISSSYLLEKLSEIASCHPLFILLCIPSLTLTLISDAIQCGHHLSPTHPSSSSSSSSSTSLSPNEKDTKTTSSLSSSGQTGGGGGGGIKRICFSYQKDGSCARGATCKFSHDIESFNEITKETEAEEELMSVMVSNGNYPKTEPYKNILIPNDMFSKHPLNIFSKLSSKKLHQSSSSSCSSPSLSSTTTSTSSNKLNISFRLWGSSFHEHLWISVVSLIFTQLSPTLLLNQATVHLGIPILLSTITKLLKTQLLLIKQHQQEHLDQESKSVSSLNMMKTSIEEIQQIKEVIVNFLKDCEEETPSCFVEGPFKDSLLGLQQAVSTPVS